MIENVEVWVLYTVFNKSFKCSSPLVPFFFVFLLSKGQVSVDLKVFLLFYFHYFFILNICFIVTSYLSLLEFFILKNIYLRYLPKTR